MLSDFITQELKTYNIQVIKYPFNSTRDSFCACYNGQWYIAINADHEYRDEDLEYIMTHELEHIRTGLVYGENSPTFLINEIERIVDTNSYLKIEYLEKNAPTTEGALNIKKRMDLKYMKNCVALLCLKNDISINELALKTGCTPDYIERILRQQEVIDYVTLKRLCEIFDVTPDFLCCNTL